MNANKTQRKAQVAILAMAALPYLNAAISGALADLAASFPQYPITLVKMVMTIASLSGMACGLLSSFLLPRCSTRHIALLYLSFMFCGGVASFLFYKSLPLLWVFALFIGLGKGGLIPIGAVAIVDFFEDEKQGKLLGLQYACCCLGGIAIMTLARLLSPLGWRYIYLTFLLCLPVGVVVFLDFPQLAPRQKSSAAAKAKNSTVWCAPFLICCLISGLFYSALCVYETNVSFIATHFHIGGAGFGSTANIAMCLGGFAAGMGYTACYKKIGRHVFTLGVTVTLVGMALVSVYQNMFCLLLCAFAAGFGMSAALPYASLWAEHTVDRQVSGQAIAIVNMFINLGGFVSPFLFVTNVNMPGAMGFIWPCITASAVLTLVLAVWLALHKRVCKGT